MINLERLLGEIQLLPLLYELKNMEKTKEITHNYFFKDLNKSAKQIAHAAFAEYRLEFLDLNGIKMDLKLVNDSFDKSHLLLIESEIIAEYLTRWVAHGRPVFVRQELGNSVNKIRFTEPQHFKVITHKLSQREWDSIMVDWNHGLKLEDKLFFLGIKDYDRNLLNLVNLLKAAKV